MLRTLPDLNGCGSKIPANLEHLNKLERLENLEWLE